MSQQGTFVIAGPADPDLPVIHLDDEVIRVSRIDSQGLWVQYNTGPGKYSEPKLTDVIAEERLDGIVFQKLRVKK